jgi:hypothetical protein
VDAGHPRGDELLHLRRRELDPGLELRPHLERDELLAALFTHHLERGERLVVDGIVELLPEGFGFLRFPAHDFAAGAADVYLSPSQVRGLNLKDGHRVRVLWPQDGGWYAACVVSRSGATWGVVYDAFADSGPEYGVVAARIRGAPGEDYGAAPASRPPQLRGVHAGGSFVDRLRALTGTGGGGSASGDVAAAAAECERHTFGPVALDNLNCFLCKAF